MLRSVTSGVESAMAAASDRFISNSRREPTAEVPLQVSSGRFRSARRNGQETVKRAATRWPRSANTSSDG